MAPRRLSLREQFAARLAEARAHAGLSQRQVGVEMGWDKASGGVRINRYERGASEPDLATLEALAAKLGVPPAYLVAETPEQAEAFMALAKASDLVAVVQALARLPASRRRALVRELLAAAASEKSK